MILYRSRIARPNAVRYIDARGIVRWCFDYTVLSTALSSSYTLPAGWYVLDRDVTAASRITCSGDVKLILVDGKTLNATAGITVGEDESFTVFGQTAQTGTLAANAEQSATQRVAGIGGDVERKGGAITINGGTIISKGGGNTDAGGAGIGSGGYNTLGQMNGDNCGALITINGGNITAAGAGRSAGIGSGTGGRNGGEIIINGGIVSATGGLHGAGIGGACLGHGGDITINGGTITTTGASAGAGIGGGFACNSGTVVITGGTINASGDVGAGIGSGGRTSGTGIASGGSVTISGGNVTASSTYGAGIGGGRSKTTSDPAPGPSVTISGGIIQATSMSGAGIGGGGADTSGTLTLDWSDTSDPSNGLPRITAKSYQVNTVAYTDANRPFANVTAPTVALTTAQIKALANKTIKPLEVS